MERHLSSKEVRAMSVKDRKVLVKRHPMHDRRNEDRRVALFSYVSAEMERRGGYDRRR